MDPTADKAEGSEVRSRDLEAVAACDNVLPLSWLDVAPVRASTEVKRVFCPLLDGGARRELAAGLGDGYDG